MVCFPPGSRERLLAINAHFDPSRMLAASGLGSDAATDQYTTADLAASPLDSMRLRVVYSIGCHFGLDVPDSLAHAVPDWQETFQAKGSAVMIGNLGYGIGDTSSIGFSERLMAGFTATLEGGNQIGAGWCVPSRNSCGRARDQPLRPEGRPGGRASGVMPMYRLPGSPSAAAAGTARRSRPIRSRSFCPPPCGCIRRCRTVPTPDGRLYVTNAGVDQAVHPYPILPAAVQDVPAGPASWRTAPCRCRGRSPRSK